MLTSIDANVMIYIGIVVLLFIIAMALKVRNAVVAKVIFRFMLGGACIYIFNVGIKFINQFFNINFSIPLNPITALIAGMLELPGVALILIVKYIIYP